MEDGKVLESFFLKKLELWGVLVNQNQDVFSKPKPKLDDNDEENVKN